jgi:hypothetical protein
MPGVFWGLSVLVCLGLLTQTAAARRPAPLKPGQFDPADETVELFAAVEAGQIEVRFIAKNADAGRILITNKTRQPLNVQLPAAMAGVPVLAQAGPGGIGAGQGLGQPGLGQGAGGNQPQAVGINGGQQGNGQGNPFQNGQGNGNGLFNGLLNIAPAKVADIKVRCVCLEHGKKEPRAAVPYRLVRLDEVSSEPAVAELLTTIGDERIDQKAAQAAAWHLANDMGWDELVKKRIKHLNGTSESYFTSRQIQSARDLVAAVRHEAALASKE